MGAGKRHGEGDFFFGFQLGGYDRPYFAGLHESYLAAEVIRKGNGLTIIVEHHVISDPALPLTPVYTEKGMVYRQWAATSF